MAEGQTAGRLYAAAQKEKQKQIRDELLAAICDMKDGQGSVSSEAIIARLNQIIEAEEARRPKPAEPGSCWDFSKEKAWRVFAGNGEILLRPFSEEEKGFYYQVRKQYQTFHAGLPEEREMEIYWEETQNPSVFFCVVERIRDGEKLGYLALKDTSKDLWEIAVELDRKFCHQGYGGAAVLLFLKTVWSITGKSTFQFLVEPDNIPCQKCMDKINAKLCGIQQLVFESDEEAEAFEAHNMPLVTDYLRALAGTLGIPPRKLLSHVLDYRLELQK